jgi:hypothetical protein
MPRKSATEPRRLYNRNGATFVLFAGRYYAAPTDSAVAAAGQQVVCNKLPSDGRRARIEASVGDTKEVWRSYHLAVKHRVQPEVGQMARAAKAPKPGK